MKMKNSGIEWIGDIPDDWEVKRLKDVAISMNSGGTPNSSDESFYSDNGTPWVIIADMKTDFVFDTQKKLSEKGLKDKKLHVYPQGTILYAMYASVGKVSELKIDAAVNQAILAIIVDKCSTNNSFLKYSLKAYEQFVAAESNGNTQYNLNAYKVSNFSFAFCSLSMQEIIAGFLDKKCAAVDRLIENQSKQIEKLKEYKQSVITDAVTKGLNPSVPMKDSGAKWVGEIPYAWSMTRVGMLFNIILGKMLCNNKPAENYTLGKYFCAANIHFDGVSYGETLKEMWFSPEEQQIYRVHNNDLLIVEGGAGAGGCTIIDEIEESIYVQNSVMIVRPVSLSDIRYLKYWIESLVKRGYISVVCNKATIPHFTKDKLANTPLAAPPIEEQRQIADYLDKKCEKIDKLIAIKQQKIEKLNEYKKSLIYEYVTGKKEVI